MSTHLRKSLLLYPAGVILIMGVLYLFLQRAPRPSPSPRLPVPDPRLANLGVAPDWTTLSRYNDVLTRAEFVNALQDVYLLGDNLHFDITEKGVTVTSTLSPPGPPVSFAGQGTRNPPPRYWRPASEIPAGPSGKPLSGIRIAIDPGHIGGKWARMEQRWYQVDDTIPVTEGDMTLLTAKLLAPRLESLGAIVSLVRSTCEPVTELRPHDLTEYASRLLPGAPSDEVVSLSEKLFYRSAEIRARAALINETMKPDLVLCLHFNAEHWGNDPSKPLFSNRNHFHMILHGSYMDGEIAHEDERLELMHKIFQRVHEEEVPLASAVATAFLEDTGLPAYLYRLGKPARQVGPALWTRNLLANRLYQCPVLFCEPYVMNNEEVYNRVQAGDYDGDREVAGKLRKSIYREYRDAVVKGLVNYYSSRPEGNP